MRAEKNIKLLGAFTVFTNMSFVIPVIVPYYRDEMGLSFSDFLLGEACFAAVVVLLEVPTGWISDVWQRKHTLALGAFFDLLGYALLMCGQGIVSAIAAQMIIGIAVSLISGTNLALLYDSLLAEGRVDEYRRLEGKRSALMFYSVAGASVAGGLLYPVGHHLPLLLSLLAHVGAIIAAVRMVEPERHRRAPEKHPVADMIETAKYALHGHAEVGVIILFSSVMFCSTKLIMWSQQPYYLALGIPEHYFGMLMAAGFMLAGASSHAGHLLDGRLTHRHALCIVWAVAVGVCLGAGIVPGLHGVALLMIGGSCLYGMAAPRVNEAINHHVSSDRRATILSTSSLMVNLLFIPVSTLMGYVSDRHGIAGAVLAIAGWLSVAGLCLVALSLRREKKRRMMAL